MNDMRRTLAWALVVLVPSIALIVVVNLAAGTWERVRTTPQKRTLRVSGSATQRIVSDLIEWDATIETRDADRVSGYRALKGHVNTALAYLKKEGIKDDAIRVSSAETNELMQTEFVGMGEERIERVVSLGWSTRQTISVRSTEIPQVEKASREITQLLEQGVPITSGQPLYHYTKLGELKIDMLAKASADAGERAQRIVRAASDADIGKLWEASMGVINVNPPNSTETSWEGNNDKSSYEKDIITVVHLTFELP